MCIVQGTPIHDFIDSYTFAYDKGIVVKNFALDRTVKLAGKTATITWSVDAQYADHLEISEDGVIFITPGKFDTACIRIDIKVGDFVTTIFRYITSEGI